MEEHVVKVAAAQGASESVVKMQSDTRAQQYAERSGRRWEYGGIQTTRTHPDDANFRIYEVLYRIF